MTSSGAAATHAEQPQQARREPAPAVEAVSAELAAPEIAAERLLAGGQRPAPPWQAAQRQTAALRLGRQVGNRHVQRFVVTPAPARSADPAPAAPEPASLPRERPRTPAPVVQRGLWDTVTNAASAVAGAVTDPRGAALNAIAGLARNVPGYHLLALVLGRDPITGQGVERNARTVCQAALSLVPGGSLIFDHLNESGALEKAFTWLEGQFTQLGLSWDAIKGLFQRAWDAIALSDFLNPGAVWERLKGIFLEPITRIKNFVVSAANKVLEFIFEGVLEKLGGGKVLEMLRQAGAAFQQIVKDPIGFLKNLLAGVKQGLLSFVANIGTHLKQGLVSWLFGALAQTGLELPKTFDLKGILSLVLQVLGLTWQNIRAQAVKLLGEKVVGTLEKTFAVFKIIQEQGLGGLWEFLKEKLSDLKEMVLGGIKDMVISQVIQAGIQWLIGLLGGPAGAVIKAIQTIYNVVTWIMDNAGRLAALVQSVVGSFQAIAAGAIDVAAQRVEQALARTVPIVIGFLAKLLGLGDLGAKIKGLIQKIQAPINKGLGWLLGKAKSFASKVFGKAKSALTPDETEAQKQQRLEKGLRAGVGVVERLGGRGLTEKLINPALGAVRLRYRLAVLEAIKEKGKWAVHGELQRMTLPTKVDAGAEPVHVTAQVVAETGPGAAGPAAGKPPAPAGAPATPAGVTSLTQTDPQVKPALIAYWQKQIAAQPDKKDTYEGYIDRIKTGAMPTWRQSELEMAFLRGEHGMLGASETQASYKAGHRVHYGSEGSTRPDIVDPTNAVVENKKYKIENLSGLIATVEKQVNTRRTDLPAHVANRQAVIVDLRGQEKQVTATLVADLRAKLAAATKLPEANIEIVIW